MLASLSLTAPTKEHIQTQSFLLLEETHLKAFQSNLKSLYYFTLKGQLQSLFDSLRHIH